MDSKYTGAFLFCFLEAVIQIIFRRLIILHKTGRNIDDDSLIGQRIVHLHAVDIVAVHQYNVVRFKFIRFAFYDVLYFTLYKYSNFMKVMVVKFKLFGDTVL